MMSSANACRAPVDKIALEDLADSKAGLVEMTTILYKFSPPCAEHN